MADESNATLNEIATLLRRQVEQTDERTKTADAQAARQREELAKLESQRLKISRVLALLLVTASLAAIQHYSDSRSLSTLATLTPMEVVEQQRKVHLHSYGTTFVSLLILGGLYYAIIDGVAYCIRRFFMPKS